MLNIQTFKGTDLPPFLSQGMAALTNPESAHWRWFTDLSNDGQCDTIPHDLVYSVCELDDNFDITPIGWASIYLWQGMPALEAYVAKEWRRKNIASACCAVLLNSVTLPTPEIAVFSDELEKIAEWLRCEKIVRFVRLNREDGTTGWVRRDAR